MSLILAATSATFATYMIFNSEREPEFAGLEHLAIFSRPARHIETPERQLAASQRLDVDYTPVGSISSSGRNLHARGFILLGVSAGKAVVQGPKAIIRVSQGDLLEGLGRVTAIERRGDKWVVVTTSGLIASN